LASGDGEGVKVLRHTPQAINKPMLVLGIERTLLGLLFVVCSIIGGKLSRPLGIALFFGSCIAAKAASKKDPKLLEILRECWKFKPVYDPIKREPFEMVIE
jgi:type IV secretory pathway TrbD component